MTRTNLTELLKANKKALQALHISMNFDFESDFEVLKIDGNFTHNTIKKAMNVDSLSDYNVALIITNRKYREKYTHFVKMNFSCFDSEFFHNYRGLYNYNVDYFFTKSDFEETRKSKEIITFVVFQKKELEKAASKKEIDFTQRFNYVSCTRWSDGKGKHGVSRLYLKERNNGKEIDYNTHSAGTSEDIHYFIDKSGYLLEEKKSNLLQRAKKLRSERAKNIVDSVNFDDKIAEIKTTITEYKNKYMSLFNECNTYESICNFENVLRSYRWLLLSVERFEKSNTEKRFLSIEEAQKKIANIYEEIEKTKNLF